MLRYILFIGPAKVGDQSVEALDNASSPPMIAYLASLIMAGWVIVKASEHAKHNIDYLPCLFLLQVWCSGNTAVSKTAN